MEKGHSKIRYTIICIVFVIALITLTFSVSFAFARPKVLGNTSETSIKTATFDIETSLDNLSALEANNMTLLNADEIELNSEKINFTVKSTATTEDAGKFGVYLKEITISNGLIDSNFKWDILMDGVVVKSGNFKDIGTKGIKSTTKEDTDSIKYFDSFYLTTGLIFNGFEESDITLRIYLLNDSTVNQNNLMNGKFECKVAVEAYSVQ